MTTEQDTLPSANWRSKRSGPLRVSATQIETATLCRRKWWLERVRKLPGRTVSKSQAFGTVLHAVAERFLRADDTGRDPKTGEPVDLYPEGWTVATNRFGGTDGEVTPAEADQIRRLIDEAIASGVLARQPDRDIEAEFELALEVEGDEVVISGFIDLCLPEAVVDHKTTKSRRYMKSPRALRETPQMLLYAKALLDQRRKLGMPDPERIELRHNQFCTDPDDPLVRKTVAHVTPAEVAKWWLNECVPTLAGMAKVRRAAERFTDIEDPPEASKACNAYGGCPYLRICAGQDSEESFENRWLYGQTSDKITGKTPVGLTISAPQGGSSKMGLKDLIASRNAQTSPTAPPPEPVPLSAAPAPTIPAPSSTEPWGSKVLGTIGGMPISTPPWAGLSPVNNGLGFNADGNPDRVSVTKAKMAGIPGPDAFEIEPMGDGTVVLLGKPGTQVAGKEYRCALQWPLNPVQVQEKHGDVEVADAVPVDPPEQPAAEQQPSPVEAAAAAGDSGGVVPPVSPAPAADPEPPVTTNEVVAVQATVVTPPSPPPGPAAEPPAEEKPKKRTRTPRGFELYIDAVPVEGSGTTKDRQTFFLSDILQEVGEQMAAANGAGSFYELDVWKRRDMLAAQAPAIAERLGTGRLFAYGMGQDARALCEALTPLAGFVSQGVAR